MSAIQEGREGIESNGQSRVEHLLERVNLLRARWADRLLASPPAADDRDEDSSIATGLVVGDESAFRLLVERQTERVFRICYRLLGSRAEAEQATAAAFVTAFARLETYDPAVRPTAWLTGVATREAWRYWHTRPDRKPLSDMDAPWTARAASDPLDGAGWPMSASERFATRLAIASLPDREREAVSLHFFGELSLDEIATLTGRTEPEVSAALERAVDLLAEAASSIDPKMAMGS